MKPTVKDFEEEIKVEYYKRISTTESFAKDAATACHALAEKMAEEFAKGFAGIDEWILENGYYLQETVDAGLKWFNDESRIGKSLFELLQIYQDYLTSQTPVE